MIFITSISPKHINDQLKATDTWHSMGKVYSLNCKAEIELLKKQYPKIEFIETTRTLEKTYGKPVVSISAMFDFALSLKDENFCFINSDIELHDNKRLITNIKHALELSVVVANRIDYTEKNPKETSLKVYYTGIDAFFLNRKHIEIYPKSMFAMGQCFWDYNVPFTAIKQGINVYLLKNRFLFHKEHPLQYSNENWLKTGRYFQIEHDLFQFDNSTYGIGKMSDFVFNKIYKTMIKKEL